jgi:large subunit ribosomal protein L28
VALRATGPALCLCETGFAKDQICENPSCEYEICETQDWSNTMAAKCDLCGKGPQFGNNISHANNTRRRWNVNLRPVKAKIEGGANKRIRVCTSCIKTGKVVKAA